MEERGKINILGTEYTIFTNASEQEKPFMNGNDGVTDFTTKEIFVAILNDGNPMNMQNMKVYEDRTIRHEIVHAFLFESGLDHNTQWARDEEIVDWIAIQSPKLFKIFAEMELKS